MAAFSSFPPPLVVQLVVDERLHDAGRLAGIALPEELLPEDFRAAECAEDHRCGNDSEITLDLANVIDHNRALVAEETVEPEEASNGHDPIHVNTEPGRTEHRENRYTADHAETGGRDRFQGGKHLLFLQAELKEVLTDDLLILQTVNRMAALHMLLRRFPNNSRDECHDEEIFMILDMYILSSSRALYALHFGFGQPSKSVAGRVECDR